MSAALAARLESIKLPRQVGPLSLPAALFTLAALCSAAGLLYLQSQLTFSLDEWEFLLHRPGFGPETIFEPHNEDHIVVLPLLVYRTVQELFGMSSALPYQLAGTASFILAVSLLFVFAKRRAGDWLALVLALPVLFLGAAFEVLLSPFQIGFTLSIVFGLAALLLLEREDRRGDILASAMLTGAVLASSVGIPVVAGTIVYLALERGDRRRLWVVAAPIVVYLLWWAIYKGSAGSGSSFQSLLEAPRFIVDGFAASLASLLGLATPRDDLEVGPLDWGPMLLVAALALAGWRIHALGGRVPRWTWVGLAIGIVFWGLVAINADAVLGETQVRTPTVSRYQFIGATAVVIAVAPLLQGLRLRPLAIAGLLAVSVAASAASLAALDQGHEQLRTTGEIERGGLTALEIARDSVDPDFLLTQENAGIFYFGLVDAGSYLDAVDEYGSPAYTEAELTGAGEAVRAAADTAIAAALRLELEPLAALPPGARCAETERGAPSVVELGPGETALRAGSETEATVSLRRYASESFPFEAGRLAPGEVALLSIPADRSSRPWTLELDASGPAEVCALGTS